MPLLILLWAALVTLHRDERGGLFDDFWEGIKRIFGAASSWPGNVLDAVADRLADLWGVLANGFALLGGWLTDLRTQLVTYIRDTGIIVVNRLEAAITNIWAVIANAAAYVGGKVAAAGELVVTYMRDVGVIVANRLDAALSNLWAVIANAAAYVGGKITDVGSSLWGVIANGAAAGVAAIRDAGSQLWGVLAQGFGLTADRIDAAASKLDDVPGKVGSEMRDALESAFGFSGKLLDDLTDISLRFLRGDIADLDALLDELQGAKPSSSFWERASWVSLMLLAIPTVISEAGLAMWEPRLQVIRARIGAALLDPEDLRDAFLRGLITRDRVTDELRRAGVAADHVETIVQLWQELPPPSDLIRMAVREAFDEGVVARFGMHQNFPETFASVASMQGYNRQWSLAYWAAHWDLPSAEQGFEMFHRGVIDFETLQLLLRVLDVMPFWRERLTQIAYNPVTRVDVRRLFAAGVINRDRVLRKYKDLGYTPDDAEALTRWTVTTYGEDAAGARDLTVAAISKALKQGRIDRAEALERLVDLGYDEDEADFLLAGVQVDIEDAAAAEAARSIRDVTQATVLRAYRDRVLSRAEASAMLADLGYTDDGVELVLAVQDFEVQNELTTLRSRVVEQEFRHGTINGGEARARLAGAGVGVDRADLVVQRWEIQYAGKDRDLTEAQLGRALEQGIIDDGAYVVRVMALGYSPEDAQILLALRGRLTTDQVRALSASQIVAAYKAGVGSRETTFERLVNIGYTPDDAEVLLQTADAQLAARATAP